MVKGEILGINHKRVFGTVFWHLQTISSSIHFDAAFWWTLVALFYPSKSKWKMNWVWLFWVLRVFKGRFWRVFMEHGRSLQSMHIIIVIIIIIVFGGSKPYDTIIMASGDIKCHRNHWHFFCVCVCVHWVHCFCNILFVYLFFFVMCCLTFDS